MLVPLGRAFLFYRERGSSPAEESRQKQERNAGGPSPFDFTQGQDDGVKQATTKQNAGGVK
jgi:hypothetical protein